MNSWIAGKLFHQADEWPHSMPLLDWGHGTDWTVGLGYEGSLHLGASGSGKTSGGIRPQTVAIMQAGYGVLYLTTKATRPSDSELCWQLARESGRENSVVSMGPTHGLGFNILRYEMQTAQASGQLGDMAANVACLFSSAAELAMPNRDTKGSDHIWRQAVDSLVRHAVSVVFAATHDLRLDDIVSVVKSAPQTLSQVSDPAWCRESACFQFIERAAVHNDRNIRLARDFFLREFPGYPPDTKNSVLFTFSAGCADLFQREPLHSMFFAGTDYTPEIMLDGAILLCDCPVNEYREVGRIANGLLRICTQRMLERRGSHPSKRPVAIIWDECQKTLLGSDVSFQDTARSASCATIAAAQNLPALRHAVGDDLAKAFLGHMRTKVFFQNNDPDTCDYMRRIAGEKEVRKPTRTRSHDGKVSTTDTFVREDRLPGYAAHNLRTGGAANKGKVTGFLMVGSKKLRKEEPYQMVCTHQATLRQSLFNYRVHVAAAKRPCPDFRYLRRVS